MAAIVPAYEAEGTVGDVVRSLLARWPFRPEGGAVIVVDDGSSDATSDVAASAGAVVVRHRWNRGKGAALRTGFERALALSPAAETAVTIDADGQHFPDDALRLAESDAPRGALVLGVRDLIRDGAPPANRVSNGISNFFVSGFSGMRLRDTQCGLRRYPISNTLALGGRSSGYAYETECILRAARSGVPIVEVPIRVHYPEERLRTTHFDAVKDPARIVFHVVATVLSTRRRRTRHVE